MIMYYTIDAETNHRNLLRFDQQLGIKPHIKVSIRLDEAANIASIDIQQKDKDDGSVHEQSALLSGGEIYLVH